MKRHFTEENIQIQIKSIGICHYISIKMAKIKKIVMTLNVENSGKN